MHAFEKLVRLMEDHSNKILVILDTSGSVLDETLDEFLCTIDDAQRWLDPEGQRLIAISDRSLYPASDKEDTDHSRIKVGARHGREMNHQLSRGGGTSHYLPQFIETDFFKNIAPTHLVLMGDVFGAFEVAGSEFLKVCPAEINLCYMATTEDNSIFQKSRENMAGKCSLHEIVGHAQRQEYLIQRESHKLDTSAGSAIPVAGRFGGRV